MILRLVSVYSNYALPGGIMITGLSNNKDHGGRTALVEYTNEGEYVTTHWMPTDQNLRGAEKTGKYADGYNYDVRVLPRRNIMLTSSFTGWSNYMMDFGKMLQDKEAMKRFGNTVVLWDLHSKQPKKVFDVPGAPLEIRCAWQPNHNWCVTTTALTSKIWLIYEDTQGEWQAKAVADVGDPAKVPLPVDISISSDDSRLWVNTFMDGKTRLFDMRDPYNPKQVYEKVIGRQAMGPWAIGCRRSAAIRYHPLVRQRTVWCSIVWVNNRVYTTSSMAAMCCWRLSTVLVATSTAVRSLLMSSTRSSRQ
jgi:selenium-binding protein 1